MSDPNFPGTDPRSQGIAAGSSGGSMVLCKSLSQKGHLKSSLEV